MFFSWRFWKIKRASGIPGGEKSAMKFRLNLRRFTDEKVFWWFTRSTGRLVHGCHWASAPLYGTPRWEHSNASQKPSSWGLMQNRTVQYLEGTDDPLKVHRTSCNVLCYRHIPIMKYTSISFQGCSLIQQLAHSNRFTWIFFKHGSKISRLDVYAFRESQLKDSVIFYAAVKCAMSHDTPSTSSPISLVLILWHIAKKTIAFCH